MVFAGDALIWGGSRCVVLQDTKALQPSFIDIMCLSSVEMLYLHLDYPYGGAFDVGTKPNH